MTYPEAVHAYRLRSLYSELMNIRQLRDDLAWHVGAEPLSQVEFPKGELRPRHHDD